jgi:hypothetical protein
VTEARLMEMQQAFTQSQPAVEKMPLELMELAENLSKRLVAINDARAQYTQAADAANSASGEDLNRLEAAAAELSSKIESRRKQVSAESAKTDTARHEQERMAKLKQREAELAAAQQAESTARAAWNDAARSLRDASVAASEARQASQTLDQLTRERDLAQANLEASLRQLELKRGELDRTIEPIAPTEAEMRVTRASDPRPLYSLIAVGAVAAVFTTLILRTAGGDSPAPDPELQARLSEIASDDPQYPLTPEMEPFPQDDAPSPDQNGHPHVEKPLPRTNRDDSAPLAV